jgi:hypothetical protein
LDGVGDRIFGRYDEVEMNMLIANVPLDDLKTLPFAEELENSLQFLFNVSICQDLTSVSGGPNYMILATVGTVLQFIEFGQHKITSFLVGDFIVTQELTL